MVVREFRIVNQVAFMTRSTNQRLLRCVVVLALLACVRPVRAQPLPVSTAEITTFSAPSADTGLFQGTTLSVNEDGVTAGFYLEATFVNHGFVLDKHSLITTFDALGASNVPGGSP
jgi:hypothetical protein